jgi:hypothetical protein
MATLSISIETVKLSFFFLSGVEVLEVLGVEEVKPLKKRNNEIIIQYVTAPTVVFHEPFVLGVSMLSDVMSKSASKMVVRF